MWYYNIIMNSKYISIITGALLVIFIGSIVLGSKLSNNHTVKLSASAINDIVAPGTNISSGSISLLTVAKHNSRSSCWSAINGGVYDLTSWIPNHPGGERAILSLCGIDGSDLYNGQHGGRSKIMTILSGFKIGTLSI
jgi:cytochrome b involved in lipid metabolism